MTGLRSGRLVVETLAEIRQSSPVLKKVYWRCRCDCGKTVDVFMSNLKNGHTQSCGCYKSEQTAKAHLTHGGSRVGKWEPLFVVWRQMISRCKNDWNVSYKYYGGRGIRVCDRWLEYAAFREDMQHGYIQGVTSLDRINNDGNYEPSNCRWATVKEQARNTRKNVWLEHKGERLCLTDWGIRIGCKPQVISLRLKRGWTVDEALTIPVGSVVGKLHRLKKHPNVYQGKKPNPIAA